LAEEAAPRPRAAGGRQIIIVATIAVVVLFALLLIGLRSCSSSSAPKTTTSKGTPAVQEAQKLNPSQVVIYSNMDLKDAAAVITRLKELKIPYQIKDEGKSVAVARSRADEARLGLAEKNLPSGGSVGWEIFDQSKLGATDFDRRIQFIRAISGELSRTINRISSVQDSRVQIVIPETQLFQATTSPVTASVLLTLNPGQKLTPMQINAIVYLVSGSVENLRRENVTIIDTDGNILASAGFIPTVEKPVQQPAEVVREEIPSIPAPAEKQVGVPEQVVMEKPSGKIALEVQAKLDLEEQLTSKVQSLLNRMYPPNITMAKVNVDSIKNKKTTVIILVDNKYKLEKAIKQTTFDTVSAAVGYDKARGDKIIMKSVKFHVVASTPEKIAPPSLFSKAGLKAVYSSVARRSAYIIIALVVAMIGAFFMLARKKPAAQAPSAVEEAEVAPEAAMPTETAAAAAPVGEVPVVDEMKTLANQNPEQVAELIKTWLAEEGA